MSKSRIGIAIVMTLIAAVSFSSCMHPTVYHPYHPAYDNGYGYRNYPPPRPPRQVIVVRPSPPPRAVYRENRRAKNYRRGPSRNNARQYGHNGRTHGPR